MGSRVEAGRGRRAVSWLATASMLAFGVAGSAVFATLGVLFAWVPPRGSAVALLARLWGRSMLAAAGVRVAAEYAPGVEPGRGYVFIANHQSYYDIPALLAATPGPTRFAAKRSLFRIPLFGWALAAGGFVPVDRADRSRAREVWAAAGRLLAAGSSVVFFPEGTRSDREGVLGPFQRGGFLVALKTGTPIVPVGIAGAARVMPRGTLRVTPGTIAVRFGAPIDPAGYGIAGKAELIARVRAEVAALAGLDARAGE